MSRSVLLPFLAGVVVAVLAAVLIPLPEHVRLPSHISVREDGGRQEDFIIRWPADRIELPRDQRSTPPSIAAAGAAALQGAEGHRASTELYRLRDVEGNVIGLATRSAVTGDAGNGRNSSSGWLLVLPARGTLFLTQADAGDLAAREQQVNGTPRVIAPGQTAAFWSGASRHRVTSGTGRILRGTHEFAGLTGTYTEVWAVGEVNADGSTTGQITLSTVTLEAS